MHAITRVCAGAALGAVLVGSLSTGAALAAESPVKTALAAATSQSVGSLRLQVVDAQNPNVSLAGAIFQLTDSRGILVSTLLATTASGSTSLLNVPAGNYFLSVVASPPGYALSAQQVPVTIAAGATAVPVVPLAKATTKATLTVKAVDEVNTTVGVSGASFKLEDTSGHLVAEVGPTDQDGSATFTGLAAGGYFLSESNSPGGYDLDQYPRFVYIEEGQSLTYPYQLTAKLSFADAHQGTWQLRNVKSGQLLDVNGGDTQPGAALIQYPGTGGTNQQWTFNTHNGHTRILSKKSSKFVAVAGDTTVPTLGIPQWTVPGSTNPGAGIVQWTETGGADQDWDFVPTADGHYNIVNAKSGLVLAVDGGTTNAGARTIQWPSNGGADQKWDLVQVP